MLIIIKYLTLSSISGHCLRIIKIYVIILLVLSSSSYVSSNTSFNYAHYLNLVGFPHKEQPSAICNVIAFHTGTNYPPFIYPTVNYLDGLASSNNWPWKGAAFTYRPRWFLRAFWRWLSQKSWQPPRHVIRDSSGSHCHIFSNTLFSLTDGHPHIPISLGMRFVITQDMGVISAHSVLYYSVIKKVSVKIE